MEPKRLINNQVFRLESLLSGFESAQEMRLPVDVREGLQDLELAIGFALADVNRLGQVHVRLGGDFAARSIERDA